MSANVLLDLLNELRKGDKMRGLSSILSLHNIVMDVITFLEKFVDFIAWRYITPRSDVI